MTMKKLLWIDGSCALVAAVGSFVLKGHLAEWFLLPEKLFSLTALISLCYAVYSYSLAKRSVNTRRQVQILIIANVLYSLFCLVLASLFFEQANVFGIIYLIIEALFVFVLAMIEWRLLRSLVLGRDLI